MEKEIQWYPLPEIRSPEDNWDQFSPTASKPQHTNTQKYTSELKQSPLTTTTQRYRSSQSYPTTCTPSEVRPSDISISTLFTVTPTNNTPLGNTTTNTIHSLKNISHHTLQSKPSPSYSQDVRSLSQSRRDGTKPTPPSLTLKTSPQTTATQRLTLSELDELWKKFLASSLASTHVVDENSKPMCTCGAVRVSQTEDEHLTMDSRPQYATKIHSERYGESHHRKKHDHVSRRKNRSTHKRESLHKERAVQTSPQPPKPFSPPPWPPAPPAPPVTFSLPPDDKRRGVQTTQLTLAEALAVQNPEFIERSLKRQRKLQQHQRDGYYRNLRQQYYRQSSADPVTGPPISYRSIASGHHPKVSMKEMYRASKKAWERLPEVKAKVNEEKRKSQAATNILRVKLYQQEVLSRLQRKRKY